MVNEGRYIRVKTRLWFDWKVKGWSSDTKLLAVFLLTSSHNNLLGCHKIFMDYICVDLDWTPERLAGPFAQLIAEGYIKYDAQNYLLLLNDYLLHNPIDNGNRAEAAIKCLRELPSSKLFAELLAIVERQDKAYLRQLAEVIRGMLPEPPGKPVVDTFCDVFTESFFGDVNAASAIINDTLDAVICEDSRVGGGEAPHYARRAVVPRAARPRGV